MTLLEGADSPYVETELVRRVALRDEEAARRLVLLYAKPLFGFVRRRVAGATEDVEEIVQDTVLLAVQMSATYNGTCPVLIWLCSLARLKIQDRRKADGRGNRTFERNAVRLDDDSRRALRKIYDASVPLEDIAEQIDRARMVQALLDSMTAEQREAVILRYVERLSVGEVACIMSKSEKAVERLLQRAKERPRQEMDRWLKNESFRALCLEVLTL